MVKAKYDEIAEWYDQWVQNRPLIHQLVVPALFELVGEVEGQKICDLACGQGLIARLLTQSGASVTGLDVSARLLEIARQVEQSSSLGITYLQGDAQTAPILKDSSFEGVTCNMALMDIPNLEATLQTVRRILRPHGWFVFSITHPCFQTSASGWITQADGTLSRVVARYFDEGEWVSENPDGVRGKIGAIHRTFSTYINALGAAGLAIERVLEPQAQDHLEGSGAGYTQVAAVVVFRCKKN